MKKIYTIIFITAIISGNSIAQKTLDTGPSWAEVTNWSDDVYPVSTDTIQLSSNSTTSTLDRHTDAERLQTGSNTNDYSIAEDASPKLLTLHKDFSGTQYWNADATVILNKGGGASSFTINNDIYIDNAQVGYVTIKNFTAEKTLTIGATSTIEFNTVLVINNKGTVNIYGDLQSTETTPGTPDYRFIFSQAGAMNILGTATISADFIQLNDNSNVIFATDAAHVITDDEISANSRGNSTLTINTADCIQGGKIRLNNNSTFNLNVNANLSSLGALNMSNNPSTLNLTIDDAVTEIHFSDSSTQGTDETDVFNIVGFKENVLRFGTDATGLTAAQLATITADGVGSGKSLELDSQGYLIVAATASAIETSKNQLRLKSNIIQDELELTGTGFVDKLEIFDLSGQLMFGSNEGQNIVDVSRFSSGVYIVKIKTSDQVLSIKFVKK